MCYVLCAIDDPKRFGSRSCIVRLVTIPRPEILPSQGLLSHLSYTTPLGSIIADGRQTTLTLKHACSLAIRPRYSIRRSVFLAWMENAAWTPVHSAQSGCSLLHIQLFCVDFLRDCKFVLISYQRRPQVVGCSALRRTLTPINHGGEYQKAIPYGSDNAFGVALVRGLG